MGYDMNYSGLLHFRVSSFSSPGIRAFVSHDFLTVLLLLLLILLFLSGGSAACRLRTDSFDLPRKFTYRGVYTV